MEDAINLLDQAEEKLQSQKKEDNYSCNPCRNLSVK